MLQLTLILAVPFVIVFGGILSCIQLFPLKSVGKIGIYTPSVSQEQSYDETLIGRAPVVLLYWCTFNRHIRWSFGRSNRIIVQHSRSLYKVVYKRKMYRKIQSVYIAQTLAFIVEQSNINARYIARFKVFTSHDGRSESCKFRTFSSTFLYLIIWQLLTKHIYFFGRTNMSSLLLVRQLWKGL